MKSVYGTHWTSCTCWKSIERMTWNILWNASMRYDKANNRFLADITTLRLRLHDIFLCIRKRFIIGSLMARVKENKHELTGYFLFLPPKLDWPELTINKWWNICHIFEKKIWICLDIMYHPMKSLFQWTCVNTRKPTWV